MVCKQPTLQTQLEKGRHVPRVASRFGFTLVELMVSVSIVLLITTVIVFRFSSFDSYILLKTLAYDVGLSVRQAQSYSVSVLGTQGASDFNTAYGLSFVPGSEEYTLFSADSSVAIPSSEDASAETVETYILGRSYTVSEVCYETTGDPICADVDRLDVSFKRPEYTAYFDVDGVDSSTITKGLIKLRPSRGATTGVVEVYRSGQIQVYIEQD